MLFAWICENAYVSHSPHPHRHSHIKDKVKQAFPFCWEKFLYSFFMFIQWKYERINKVIIVRKKFYFWK